MDGEIIFGVQAGIATITLNRPEKLNSFNRSMALSLQRALDECALLSNVRCVLITGNGKAFSAGQDLAEVTGENAAAMPDIVSEYYNPIVSRIRHLQKPVLAAVNGVAAGAGANIALCCDVAVACYSASFIQAFSKIGLIPDSGGTFFLPRLVGWQKASALMMLGDRVNAVEAEALGMIYKAFPDEEFFPAVLGLATQLSELPTRGLAFTKQALNFSLFSTLEEQLNREDALQKQAANTNDYAEGVQAFLQKRKPVFSGK